MTIIVCGAGTMGSGIAETAARSGYPTILFDLDENALNKAKQSIEKNFAALREKDKISEGNMALALARLIFTTELSRCHGNIIIEAIVEKLVPKIELFSRLAELNGSDTIFASNTSSLSINSLAEHLPFPERVCGMHFFNPAQIMKLVELVKGEKTAAWVIEQLTELSMNMGKSPVICKDSPGFIVNRVARHYYLESLQLLAEGAEIAQVDRILEGSGFKMGPFKLMDLIGNDVNLAVTISLYEACGKPVRFKPSAIQEQKFERGELGRKTGKGYYTY